MKHVAIPMEELVKVLQLQMETAGSARLTVTGNSMYPMLLHRRDSVTLVPVAEPLKKADLILYRRENGAYVLHRILQVRSDGLILCGDNQYRTEKIQPDQVLAVVTAFTRKGKAYQVTDKGYCRYVAFWTGLHPVRWLYLGPRRAVGYIIKIMQRLAKKSVTK